jgi:hypothetical protein
VRVEVDPVDGHPVEWLYVLMEVSGRGGCGLLLLQL